MARSNSKAAVDMTTGSPARVLLMFALPMIFSNIFQQFYNLVDMLVVGNYIGSNALAAISTSAPISNLFISTAMGLSGGAAVVISQYFGAKMKKDVRMSIQTMLTFSVVAGVILSVLGIALSRVVLGWINTPAEVMDQAQTYLNIYFVGTVFLFLYNTLNSSYNALGNSKTPLYFLIFSSLLNVALDLIFVVWCKWGVAGAAWATTISQAVAAVLSFFNMSRKLTDICPEKASWWSGSTMKTIMKIAIPNAVQMSIMSFCSVFIQSAINSFGPAVMAGVSAASRIESLATMPLSNVGNAFGSFTGQNIGAGKTDRIKAGMRFAVLFSIGVGAVLAAILIIFAPQLVSLFVDTADANYADMIRIGTQYIRFIAFFSPVFGVFMTLMSVLRGAGDMVFFLSANFTNFLFRVFMAVFVSPKLGPQVIWWSSGIGWSLATIISGIRYLQGGWRNKAVVRTKAPEEAEEA